MPDHATPREGQVLRGPLFSEPMRVETVRASGDGTWTFGLVGTQSERFRKVTLTSRDLEGLAILDADFTYNGDGRLLRLGLQAYALGSPRSLIRTSAFPSPASIRFPTNSRPSTTTS